MQYVVARPRIYSGDLLAWSHHGWRSWYDIKIQLVRIFTRSEYCHVGIAWVVGGRVFVLEAVQSGVRIFPLSRLLPFYWLSLRVKWELEVEAWALRQIGEPYSTWQAILAGFGLLRAGEDAIWQCAEYAQEVLARAEFKLEGSATPSNLVRTAKARGAVEYYVEA